MGMTLRDYYVQFRREETIADAAVRWRRAGGSETAPYFNIVRFVLEVLRPTLQRQGIDLHLKFFEGRDEDLPAYVTVEPLTLHVDREIWESAERGDPRSRLVVAHEVGHIVLHGTYPKAAFSDDPEVRLKAFPQENSAEWQANVFADHFLVPTRIASAFGSAWQIFASCGVPLEVAERRFTDLIEDRFRRKYGVSPCSTCGEFSCSKAH
jgi:hypothetical protein